MRVRDFTVVCLLLIASLSGGCFRHQLASPKARWVRVETEHFRLHTDLSEKRARAQALELERILHAFLEHGWVHNGTFPLTLNVIMFESPYELERYVGLDVLGYAPRELLFEPWIVLSAPRRAGNLDTLRHELTHYIAGQALPHQPRWFAEGIACYFETARFVNGTDFEVGGVPLSRFYTLQRDGMLPLSELWRAPDSVVMTPRFYATSWALVHYLMTEHPEGFIAYQDGLAQGLSDGSAWETAFPTMSRTDVEAHLQTYLTAKAYEKVIMQVGTHPATATVRSIDRAGQYALEGLLWSSCTRCGEAKRARARSSFEMALKLDPQQPQALAVLTMMEATTKEQALKDALLAAHRHPSEWLSWMALAQAQMRVNRLGRVGEVDPVPHLVQLAPRNAYTWIFSAVQHAQRGKRELALRDLRKMRRLAPTNVALLLAAAQTYRKLHACEPLRDVSRSLHNLSHTGVPAATLRNVREWSALCQDPPSGPRAPIAAMPRKWGGCRRC